MNRFAFCFGNSIRLFQHPQQQILLNSWTRIFGTHVIKVPQMGESVSSATISAILKQTGEAVKEDEIVVVLETDKVSQEVPTPMSGVVQTVHVKKDQTVAVDAPLLTIDTSKTGSTDSSKSSSTSSSKQKTESESKGQQQSSSQPQQQQQSQSQSSSSTEHKRIPSIHFRYGVREEKTDKSSSSPSVPPSTSRPISPSSSSSSVKHDSNSYSIQGKKSRFTENQMKLIVLGGAEPDPEKVIEEGKKEDKGKKPKK